MFSIQVFEFVGLTELYYAGSHGMDIMGPVGALSNDHPNSIRSTNNQVNDLNTYRTFFGFLKILVLAVQIPSLLGIQGKEVNLFQPASEFLPMINEVSE